MAIGLSFALLLTLPLLTLSVPSENLQQILRAPPARTCNGVCYAGKGKAYQECGNSRNRNPNCYLYVCELSNLGGQIHSGYGCYPYYVEPSYPPYPRYTPEPRETFAPVPTVDCPETCQSSQGLADDDCLYDGLAIAGCRVDSSCSASTGSGFQCAPYEGVSDTTTFVSSIDGLELVVKYEWGPGQYDLDSSTGFLGDFAGVSCNYNDDYIEFQGDNVSEGGTETYVVRVSQALDDSAWVNTALVNLYGGWYDSDSTGSITITASLRDAVTGTPVANSEVSISATPNYQTSCRANLLGTVTISLLAESTKLEISSA